ncbi:MAG: hypothetical protein DMD91_20515 [Candidatus Rokuibacteriota bacterium]|nr:MAG: hypothetical protein DMD91_20515 [Candidatus Rokubacteria bacterium]
MPEEISLEGWAPAIGVEATLDEVVDRAFDYRGDVTVVMTSGRELAGYVYNRDRHVAQPYVQMFDAAGASHTFPYSEIRAIRFTGKDTAAGQSYEAWLRRKAEAGSRPEA